MTRYAQVTLRLPEQKRRTVRLEIMTDNGKVLTGYAVTKEGERITKRTDNGEAECLYVIAPNDILRRIGLRMNLHYAELEPEEVTAK